jgi:hypothetical protein
VLEISEHHLLPCPIGHDVALWGRFANHYEYVARIAGVAGTQRLAYRVADGRSAGTDLPADVWRTPALAVYFDGLRSAGRRAPLIASQSADTPAKAAQRGAPTAARATRLRVQAATPRPPRPQSAHDDRHAAPSLALTAAHAAAASDTGSTLNGGSDMHGGTARGPSERLTATRVQSARDADQQHVSSTSGTARSSGPAQLAEPTALAVAAPQQDVAAAVTSTAVGDSMVAAGNNEMPDAAATAATPHMEQGESAAAGPSRRTRSQTVMQRESKAEILRPPSSATVAAGKA